ncbi:MAG: LPS assembly protein LptD [Candidatus Brocadiaceae bacterium]|nr:LPS assembly protein LptD [Candidatus Brocadiaceae bacterium]
MRKLQTTFFIFILSFICHAWSYGEGLLSVKNILQRPFSLSAEHVSTWEKDGVRTFVGNKNVKIFQGPFQITADATVCWFHEEEARHRKEATVEVYCEGNVTILIDENYENYEQVYLTFETMTGIVVNPDIQPIETFEEAQEMEVVVRGEAIRSKGEEEYLSMDEVVDVSDSGVSRGEMIDIIADSIDSWEEGDKRVIVALGNVKIKRMDTEIHADNVILWLDREGLDDSFSAGLPLSEIYAEGNVTMRREEDLLIADRIFENVREEKGILLDAQIKTSVQATQKKHGASITDIRVREKGHSSSAQEELPINIGGDEILHAGKGQYEIKNGVMTTCGYGHPHYHFKGKKIRLEQKGVHNYISSKHNVFYLDKYPVGYFPYFSLDVKKKEKLLENWELGSSSRFGSFLRTDWNLYVLTGGQQKEWSSLLLKLDYLQDRGLGTGLDFEYEGKDIFGYSDTYYIKDFGDNDINDIPIENTDRGTVLWRHRQSLPYGWRLDMEYSYLSDPGFLREYFQREFKTEKDRETVLYLRKLQDTTAMTFLINEQFNGFDTTVDSLREENYAERLPEVAYRIIGEPIWNNRLIFTSESKVTYFNGSFDRKELSVDPQPVTRIDSVNRVSMPLKPWFFRVKPYVEGRVTGYTESIDTSGHDPKANDSAAGRFAGSFGFDMSSTHWRTYSVYNDFLKINRLRHIFVPELRYMYTPVVTKDPNRLYQYDEIDALDFSQVLVFGVKNKLQTKRGRPGLEKAVDFVNFNVDYYLFPTNDGITNDGINGIIVRNDNFINLDFKCKITDALTFISERNEFNTAEFQFDVLNSGIEINHSPDWHYFVGHRYIRDVSSTLSLAVDYRINEKWSVFGIEKYDLKSFVEESDDAEELGDKRNLKTNVVLSRYFHDWVGSITLELDPVRDDSSLRFDITPKGLEKTQRRFWF